MDDKRSPKEIHDDNRLIARVRDLMQTIQWKQIRRELDAAMGGDGRDPNEVAAKLRDLIHRQMVDYIAAKWTED